MITYRTTATILLIVFRLLCVFIVSSSSLQLSSSCSMRTTNNGRKARKAEDKFLRWIDQCQKPTGDGAPLLIVDGNNVRGFGKFEWSPVELQDRVACFCHQYRISTAVIVWDHGSNKFASMQRYLSLASSTDGKHFCVDTVILFSGLRERADDVILAESRFLNSLFYNNQGWRSMAFVTNDRELNFKLRRQSSSTPTESSLRRNRMGGVNDSESTADGNLNSSGPLFCNSCHFVELLQRVSQLERNNHDVVSRNAAQAVSEAKESLAMFSMNRGRGSNPRRESTWERCVIAEAFRRSLCHSLAMTAALSASWSDLYSNDPGHFSVEFLTELQESRGYETPWNIPMTSQHDPTISSSPFQGPARMDKRQRRLLGAYNSFLKRETSSATSSSNGIQPCK
jgi:hypothetical protein